MSKESNLRNESIHLYDPIKEGWSSYDINYINALRKKRKLKSEYEVNKTQKERYAA